MKSTPTRPSIKKSTSATPLDRLSRAIEIAEKIQQLQVELQKTLGGFASNPSVAVAASVTRAPKAAKKSALKVKAAAAKPAKAVKTSTVKAPVAKARVSRNSAKAARSKAVKSSGRGKFTPEWRAKLAEAARLRWARARGEA